MKREIKFRAFDGEIMLYYEPQTTEEYEQEWVDFFFKRCYVMQFTGMEDKNGVNVYEDDICSFHFFENYDMSVEDYVPCDIYHIGIVKYSDYSFIFKTKDYSPNLKNYCIDTVEVLGNIYQNIELI